MKRKVFVLISLILLLSNTGCGNVEDTPIEPSNSFAEEFSIRDILDVNEMHLITIETVSGSKTESFFPLYYKNEEAIVQLDPENEVAFMEAVWSDVQAAIRKSGALIDSADKRAVEKAEHFSCKYNDGEMSGLIDMWGVQGQGTEYTLIVLIVESKGNE